MDPRHSDFRIEKTTHLLRDNSSRTVTQVAGACSLSTSRLSHLFKAQVGPQWGSSDAHAGLRKPRGCWRTLLRWRSKKSLTRLDIIIPPVLRVPFSMTWGSHPLITESTSYVKSGA